MSRPWFNVALWSTDDGSDTSLFEHHGRLVLAGPIYDNRDGLVGSWSEPAPPAQQYAFRLQLWHRRQQELAARLARPVSNEPF